MRCPKLLIADLSDLAGMVARCAIAQRADTEVRGEVARDV